MPTFGMLGKYKIKLHGRDHNPPHVHFEYGDVGVCGWILMSVL